MSGYPTFSEIGRDIKDSIKEALRAKILGKRKCDSCGKIVPSETIKKDIYSGYICKMCADDAYYWDNEKQEHIKREEKK